MPTDPERLKKYLVSETADTRWVSDKLVTLLSGEAIIPPFSAAAIKLGQITRDENCQMEEVGEVISMDPGLASDVIRVASSVGFAARRIASIDQAMMLIGLGELRRIAFAMGVMKNFEHLKSQVDWSAFWLHSIMVARLTERVAAAYRPPGGSEFLRVCFMIVASWCWNIIFQKILTASSSAPPSVRAAMCWWKRNSLA